MAAGSRGSVALASTWAVRKPAVVRPCRSYPLSAFAGYRFPPEVIVVAVRWYLRFGLSYRVVWF